MIEFSDEYLTLPLLSYFCIGYTRTYKSWTSGQDGGVGRYTLPSCTIKRRTMTNLKTKKQPELPENQTAWNSDNQEETFIQSGRRGRDRQLGQRGCAVR